MSPTAATTFSGEKRSWAAAPTVMSWFVVAEAVEARRMTEERIVDLVDILCNYW